MILKPQKTDDGKFLYACDKCKFKRIMKQELIMQCPVCRPPKASSSVVPLQPREPRTRPKIKPLGDRVEDFLTSYGMTKEFYSEMKQAVGLPPGCNCSSRQTWLNKFGEKYPSLSELGGKLLEHLTRKPG